MQQPTLEDYNALLENRLSDAERQDLVARILADPTEAARFRMLRELHTTMQAPEQAKPKEQPVRIFARFPQVRYALGVAAVLFMAFFPNLMREGHSEQQPQADMLLASQETLTEAKSLQIRDKIRALNIRQAGKEWGKSKTTLQLVELANR